MSICSYPLYIPTVFLEGIIGKGWGDFSVFDETVLVQEEGLGGVGD